MGSDNGETPRQARQKDRPLSPLERMVQQAMGEAQDLGAEDDPAKEAYPALWEFMSRTQVGKDSLRTPCRLSVALVVGGVVATITDVDMKRSLSVAVNHLDSALAALDKLAADPKAPWRPWGKGEPTLRKRRAR